MLCYITPISIPRVTRLALLLSFRFETLLLPCQIQFLRTLMVWQRRYRLAHHLRLDHAKHTWMKWRRKTCASPCTSSGHVALNMSVWRSVLHCCAIFRNCGSNPISSMRSACNEKHQRFAPKPDIRVLAIGVTTIFLANAIQRNTHWLCAHCHP